MKKHIALKMAHRNYPKGTIFLNISGSKKECMSSGSFNLLHNESNDGWNIHDAENKNHVFSTHYNKWAELVEKKEPLLVSEDGVELFEGDKFWYCLLGSGKWTRGCEPISLCGLCGVINAPETHKAFSTKEAVEKWITEHNKPKEIEVKLSISGNTAEVTEKGVTLLSEQSTSFYLNVEEFNNISHALKQLSC